MNKFQISNDKDFIPYLEENEIPYRISDDKRHIIIDRKDDFELDDYIVFDIIWSLSKRKYEEKPESFWLPKEYVPLLQASIRKWSEKNYITVNSFRIDEKDPDAPGTELAKITVLPTRGIALFGIYAHYGKLVVKHDALKLAGKIFNTLQEKGAGIGNASIPFIAGEIEKYIEEEL